MLIGFLIIYAALHSDDEDPELVSRGFSREANAAFLSVSAFNNAGYTLSSQSVFHLRDNPIAYLTLALLIVAGNTMAPVFYRLLIIAELFSRHLFGVQDSTVELQFILDNPRKVSVNTLPTREVIFLFITSTALNVVQYLFYLGASMWRQSIKEEYGSPTRLAGLGFFQTISTRNAGLQIMDLRTMNQGMLLVYAICMYLSGAPFVTALYASEDSSENTAVTTKTDTKESGHTDTCATTEDETILTGDEDLDEKDEEEGVEKKEEANEVDGTRASRRGGFLLAVKSNQRGDDGDTLTTVTVTATATTTASSACPELPVRDLETGDGTFGTVAKENELDNLLPSVLRRKSTIGTNPPDTAPGAASMKRRESRRGSTIADIADLIRSSVMLEPTKRQVACALNVPEKDVASMTAAPDTLRRRSSQTVTFDDQQEVTAGSDGSALHPHSGTDNDTSASIVATGGTLLSQRRSSTGSLGVETSPTANNEASGTAGMAAPHGAQQAPGTALVRRSSISNASQLPQQGPHRRRSSLVNIVGGMPAQALVPAGAANMGIIMEGPKEHRPTISEDQYRALMRHNSVQLLNQRKFEIQNKFIETFIMKHSFFIGLGVFVCAFSEDRLMVSNPATFNLWYIIFEVVSAYGNVGLSLGVPGQSMSLCGNFGVVGKLAIILIMLLGKHRGMPKERDAVIDFKYRRLKRGVASLIAQLEQEKKEKDRLSLQAEWNKRQGHHE